MKKLILFFIFVLSVNTLLRAQNPTVSTINQNAAPGDTLTVPVDVALFSNVGSFLIKLQYDPTVLQWLNPPVIDQQISTASIVDSSGTVTMQWVGQSALDIASGTIINLKFIYLGGTSQLTYLIPQSIVTDPLGNVLNTSYINGSVVLKNNSLSVTKTGNGRGSIKVNGVLHNLPYNGVFSNKSLVTLEAVPDQNNHFTGWSGDVSGTANPVIVNMNKNKSVSVGYSASQFSFTVNKSGNGQVKINDTLRILPYTSLYSAGTQVKIEAVPDTGNQFSNWSGDINGTGNPVIVVIDTNKTITANFALLQYNLAINPGGNGSGTIKVNGTAFNLPYSGNFNFGENVSIEAVPLSDNSFTGWTGDLTGTTNPTGIVINGNKSITANFGPTIQYSLTLDKVGGGQIKVNDTLRTMPFVHNYVSGSQVKIEAVPDPGNIFTGWSGSFIGTTNPVIIAMNGNKTIYGNFKALQYTITINKSGNGDGKIKVNGVLQALPYTAAFNSGTQVTLEAVPETGSNFTGWSGDLSSTNNPASVVINKNMTIAANFDLIKYTLFLEGNGNGSGKVKINGLLHSLPHSEVFNYNTNVTIEAVPDSNSKFFTWTGDLTGTGNPAVITINGNKAIQVNFSIIQYTLTINKGGNGQVKVNGTLVTLPFSALYNSGTKVSLEAVPDNNYQFIGWSGDLTGNANPASINIDKDRVVTALFDVNIYSLTISKGGNGSGQVKVNGTLQSLPYAGTFNSGTQVTIEATGSEGSSFTGWTGDVAGNTNPATVLINGNKKINAIFTLITYTLSINKGGNGNGQIKINGTLHEIPYSTSFNYSSDITLEAVSAAGSSFTSWSGDLNGNKNPNTIKINANMSITMTFSVIAPDIPAMKYPGNNYKYISISPTLSWAASANALTYHFQLSTDSSFSSVIISDSGLTAPGISLNSLKYKTKYFWRIRAKNPGGYSNFTTPWSFVTKIEPLGCPSNLTVSASAGKVQLQWDDNATNEIGYQIFRKNGDSLSSKSYVNIGSVGKDISTFVDQYLNGGEIYTYLVYAYNSDTISCLSNQASIQAVTAVSEKQIPKNFELFQNYPNPFNPATKIIFDLPSELNVSLRVFDMLGREVVVLINNEIKSAGRYTINFDGSNLSSGEYFYLIRAGEYTAAKKFILLK